MRAAVSLILSLAAGSAAAQEQWSQGFRDGFSTASVTTRRGEALRLTCDTGGARPGRGVVAIDLRAPAEATAGLTPHLAFTVMVGGQTFSFRGDASVATAAPAAPQRGARSASGATETILTIAHRLDGSPDAAGPVAALAAALARETREAAIGVPALLLSTRLPAAQAARALRGFDKGCQDSLPAADDELQWDWNVGLDRIGEKPQVTLAASLDPNASGFGPTASGGDGPRLMLVCGAGPLEARIAGLRSAGEAASFAARIDTGHGRVQAIWSGRPTPGAGWTLTGDEAARFVASIWRAERVTIGPASADGETATFAVAGLPLAARRLIEACPSPLLPPRT
jgi:hypothetical protein